jgi:uncharacterized membrane protein YeaQ/YmgE (transglycosylase-associated protein family)
MGLVLTIVIGSIAGIIAKFLHPGNNEPGGVILTRASVRSEPFITLPSRR